MKATSATAGSHAVIAKYKDHAEQVVETGWAEMDHHAVAAGRPWRTFPWYLGQRNYSGRYWSATERAPVGYESLLELSRAVVAHQRRGLLSVHVELKSDDLIGVVGAGAALQSGEELVIASLELQHRIEALRSPTVSMGFGYMRRRCTSKAKHTSATSLGRERDRPVCFSIRRNRWRTVFG